MAELDIAIVPILGDNYAYLLTDRATGSRAVVDPGEAGPVLAHLQENGQGLDWIILTHHHRDHVGGVAEVKAATGARTVGPRGEAETIGGLDGTVGEGDRFELGRSMAKVLETPGHTRSPATWWFEEAKALFPGDTLFVMGCGRLIERDAEAMWRSLSKLAALPEDTRVYCGHEYTLANARFAVGIDPTNEALRRRLEEVRALREGGRPTVPSTIGQERATNPFLRAADPAIRRHLGMERASDAEVFAEIRRRKDRA
jgi:hydroxyacylglutathione hydrolase